MNRMQDTTMNSSGVNVSDSPTPGNLFDEFEEAYQNCMSPLTKDDPLNNGVNQDELRTNADANAQRFLDLARQMEAFFLQKRYLLAAQKPELILMEDVTEMRNEIVRKDELIKRHSDKLSEWMAQLVSLQARPGTTTTTTTTTAQSNVGSRSQLSSGPGHHVSMLSNTTNSQVSMSAINSVGGISSVNHNHSSTGMNMNSNLSMSSMVGSSMMSQSGPIKKERKK